MKKGWVNEEGNRFFAERRAKNSLREEEFWFRLQIEIINQMDYETDALHPDCCSDGKMSVLDLCMAPGGFTYVALRVHGRAREAEIDAITLPVHAGGHKVAVRYGETDPRVKVLFEDITMFSSQFGVPRRDIPDDHPERNYFLHNDPLPNTSYDLVICDGQTLCGQPRGHRRLEGVRLLNAQLILGLQRIKQGGNLVALLHKIDAWDTAQLLYTFSRFSDVHIFKHKRVHAFRSGFHMVAKNVQSQTEAAQNAIARFKKLWKDATFGDLATTEDAGDKEGAAEEFLEVFGDRLRELGQGVWETQVTALRRAPFIKVE